MCHMYDGIYFDWARTEVVLRPRLPVATESWQLSPPPRVSLCRPFLFPRELSVLALGGGGGRSQGRRVAWHDTLGPGRVKAPRTSCPPPPPHGQEAALPAPHFSSDHPLAEAFLLPAMERGCTMGYLNSSAQISAVHDACQGLWSTDTCVPGYNTKHRFILSYVCRCVARASDTWCGGRKGGRGDNQRLSSLWHWMESDKG